ncbi:hypothetical protein EDC94DRAFT_638534 [Helicostylum pulchrum]|nr:hypothetical protein EDC94DRAFT_638534 [Helicostylum pulchrum]
MLAMSPYIKLLQKREYFELSAEYFGAVITAQLLAGSIINNAINNGTVMVNTIEIYGRKKIVDNHREPFGNKKHQSIRTSIPSVGGVTTNFQLLGEDSLSISIYLVEKSIKKAKSLAENIYLYKKINSATPNSKLLIIVTIGTSLSYFRIISEKSVSEYMI